MSTADVVVLVACAFTGGFAAGALWVIWRWMKYDRMTSPESAPIPSEGTACIRRDGCLYPALCARYERCRGANEEALTPASSRAGGAGRGEPIASTPGMSAEDITASVLESLVDSPAPSLPVTMRITRGTPMPYDLDALPEGDDGEDQAAILRALANEKERDAEMYDGDAGDLRRQEAAILRVAAARLTELEGELRLERADPSQLVAMYKAEVARADDLQSQAARAREALEKIVAEYESETPEEIIAREMYLIADNTLTDLRK